MEAKLQGPYLLKLLAGPNQGAEIALNEETLLIGSGQTADIVLSDSLVAAEHVRIRVEKNVVTLLALAPGVAYKTRVLEVGKVEELELFTPVGIGTSYFVVGPRDARWPQFTLEELLSKEKEAIQLEATSHLAGKIRTLSDAALYGLLGAIVLAISLAFQLFWISPEKKESTESSGGTLHKKAGAKALNNHDLKNYIETLKQDKGLRVEQFENGDMLIAGYLDTFEELMQVERALRPYQQTIRLKLIDNEGILASAKEILQSIKVSMTPEALPKGGLKLTGYLTSREKFDELKERLMRDIPGLAYIEEALMTDKDILEKTEKLLASVGLEDKLMLGVDKGSLSLIGNLSVQQEDAWTRIYTTIRKELRPYLKVTQQVSILDDKAFLHWVFGDAVDSVTGGETPWVSLLNGQKLFVGAKLRYDYVLHSIEPNRITLTKSQSRLMFKIGE